MPLGAAKVALLGAAGSGGEPTWVMEVIARTNAGTHANFWVADVKTNPHDGKTYIAGMWDNYYTGGFYYDYGPFVGLLKSDGTADLDWWTMNWYNHQTVRTIGQSQKLFFAPSSTDVYVSSRFERGSTGVMWARFNDSGVLQNATNGYVTQTGNSKMCTDGTRVLSIGAAIVSGYTRYQQASWPYNSANAVADNGGYAYESWSQNVTAPRDGATYYTNGGTGYGWSFPSHYTSYTGAIISVPMNSTGINNRADISVGNTSGALGAKGDGDNTAGLAFSAYPTHHGMTNAAVTSISWSKTLTASSGSVSTEGENGPHIDTDGNVYVFGQDNSKGFVVKYDSSGTVLWQRHLTVTVGGSTTSNEIKTVTTSQDGSILYVIHYVGALQYGGSGTTKFPRMTLWRIKADGSESGSFTIDNSSGTGSGDTDVYTLSASSMTVNAGSISLGTPAGVSGGGRASGHQSDPLVTVTPWSPDSPVLASADIS